MGCQVSGFRFQVSGLSGEWRVAKNAGAIFSANCQLPTANSSPNCSQLFALCPLLFALCSIALQYPDDADFLRLIELMQKYADLPMDFTDGLLVAICERLGVKQIATVDGDFAIYRYKGRGKFENVFF